MRLEKRNVSSPVGLGWSQEAVFRLPLGRTLQYLVINHSTTRAELERVAIEVNGQEIIITNATDLHTIESYKGGHTTTGKTVVRFSELMANTLSGQMLGGLALMPNDNAVLKISVGAGTGAISVDIDCYTTAIQNRIYVPTMRTVSAAVAINGVVKLENLVTTGKGIRVKRMIFKASDMAKLIVRQGGRRIYESTMAANDYDLQVAERTPQADHFIFDPTMHGWSVADLLDTVSSITPLEFEIETNDPARTDNNMPVIVETVNQVKDVGK